MAKVYRQGDVILRERKLPTKSIKVRDKLVIQGETGKVHEMEVPVFGYRFMEYVVLEAETPIVHPEHETIYVEPGVYLVTRVRDALEQTPRGD